jgi:biotin carboxyl carrier protein
VPREQTVRILAEMVANVIAIDVSVGDAVAAGDPVCLLESMKMEIPVLTEHAGTVATIKVTPGDVVQEGDILVELTAER